MRPIFAVGIVVWLFLCIGFLTHIEIENRRYVENLSPFSLVNEATTPSGVWFQITDPYERAEAYREQLTQQYGDQAAIDTLAELKPKIWQNIPLTLDEMIRHAEAQMDIWPTEGTRSSIELFKKWKAEGHEVNFQYGPVPPSTPELKEFGKYIFY